ncbi:MAG TPA: hypothetical protein VMV89_07910 [Candidatus Paceibacterota bacterium]|nr:hypothetical protein [Candidatus Paceibacterota bacterium]
MTDPARELRGVPLAFFFSRFLPLDKLRSRDATDRHILICHRHQPVDPAGKSITQIPLRPQPVRFIQNQKKVASEQNRFNALTNLGDFISQKISDAKAARQRTEKASVVRLTDCIL